VIIVAVAVNQAGKGCDIIELFTRKTNEVHLAKCVMRKL
jgi:hypothetical protein